LTEISAPNHTHKGWHWLWPIFMKPVGSHSLWKAPNWHLKWENPLLVTFDIYVLTVRKNINKYIVSVAFAMKWFKVFLKWILLEP